MLLNSCIFPSEDGLGVSYVRPSTIKQKVLDHQTADQIYFVSFDQSFNRSWEPGAILEAKVAEIRMDLLWICHFNKHSQSA